MKMSDSSYPRPVAAVIQTLGEICRHQKETTLLEYVENAYAYFEEINYDNWNGGTTTWALRLEVPVALYALAHPTLTDAEKCLLERLSFLDRLYPHDPIGEVSITPATSAEIAMGQRMAPSEAEVQRLWQDGFVRLFLSHVSAHKESVSQLKLELLKRGVSAFVAHMDIEPALEWQNEIALALRSMHALVALITPDFHPSNWTDQEIGWALGRGVPALPVALGATPYGFIGKTQAISGWLNDPSMLADRIVQSLLTKDQTHGIMRRGLVIAFESAGTVAIAKQLKDIIVRIQDFTDEEKERLRTAGTDNDQISHAHGVVSAIHATFGAPVQLVSNPQDDVPF